MRPTRLGAVTAALLVNAVLAPAANAQIAGLTGGWVYEGASQELVVRSTIQHRSYTMPGDFGLGGGFPNAVISTTPTPTLVQREMALIIQADGSFSWVVDKSYDESAGCRVSVAQTKVGSLTSSGSSVTLTIRRGSERATRSCGGRVSEGDLAGRSETYRMTRSGSTLAVSDGTVTWRFRRHAG